MAATATVAPKQSKKMSKGNPITYNPNWPWSKCCVLASCVEYVLRIGIMCGVSAARWHPIRAEAVVTRVHGRERGSEPLTEGWGFFFLAP